MASPTRQRYPEDGSYIDELTHESLESVSEGRESIPIGGLQMDNEDSLSVEQLDVRESLLDSSGVVEEVVTRVLAPEEEAGRFFVGYSGSVFECSNVGFICAANTTWLECRMQACHLCALGSPVIDVIYNPARRLHASRSISQNDPRLQLLHRSWDDFFHRNPDNNLGRLQFCSGDGTNIVKEALKSYPRRDRITVISIGSSCQIPSGLCFLVRHYNSYFDIFSASTNSPGSPAFVNVSSGSQARGLFDSEFHSSTFQEIIRMEIFCFRLRQRLLADNALPTDFDEQCQMMREFFVGNYQNLADIPPWLIEAPREEGRRVLLSTFLRGHRIGGIVDTHINLCESFEDEYPEDRLGVVVTAFNLSNDLSPVALAVLAAVLRGSVSLAPAVLTSMEGINFVLQSGAYLVPRNQESSHFLRTCSFRGRRISELVLFICESIAVSVFVLYDDNLSQAFLSAMGARVVFSGLNIFFQHLTELYSPLRGRIQEFFVENEEGNISTDPNENREARQYGAVQRLLRSLYQASYGLGSLAIAGALVQPLICSPEIAGGEGSNANSDSCEPLSLQQHFTGIGIISVVGVLAVGSVIMNLVQIGRIVRRLRNRRSNMEVELVAVRSSQNEPEDDNDEADILTVNEAETVL